MKQELLDLIDQLNEDEIIYLITFVEELFFS